MRPISNLRTSEVGNLLSSWTKRVSSFLNQNLKTLPRNLIKLKNHLLIQYF